MSSVYHTEVVTSAVPSSSEAVSSLDFESENDNAEKIKHNELKPVIIT